MQVRCLLLPFVALAARASADNCNSTTDICYHNPDNLILKRSDMEIGPCCDLCHTTDSCASFTHWGGPNLTAPANCYLFSTVGGGGPVAQCTSGTSGRAPAPAAPTPAPAPAPGAKPNFVLYLAEAARAESLGTYGHPIAKTPAFDRLAAQGTLFRQAHALHPLPAPSRVAAATGRYAHTKGHRTAQHLVQSWESDVFGLLHDAGYYVAFFGKNDVLSAESLKKVDRWDPAAGVGNASAITAFLAAPPKQPFVVLVSSAGAAPPYVGTGGAPPAFGDPGYYSYYNNGASVYDAADVAARAPPRPAQPAASRKPSYHAKMRQYRQLDSLAADYFDRLNAVYLQAITQRVDGLLGTVLDALAANPAVDAATAVVAAAEAGDFAGDFGLVGTWGGGLDDVLTRVPLVARAPGGAAGHVVDEQVQLFDVFPTLLELALGAGHKTRNTHFARSLVPQLMGAQGDAARTVYAEAGFLYPSELEPLHSGGPAMAGASDPKSMEYPRRQEELEGCPANVSLRTPNWKGCVGSPRATMARTLTHKLVYRPDDVSELYDLADDPRELVNRWGDAAVAEVQGQLLDGLLQWYQETSDTTDWQVRTGRGAPKMPDPKPPMLPNGTRAPGDKRPNIVFYFPDTVRAESCGGVFGNPVVETPFMDALARNGTAFTQAHVLHTQCAPSRHAIITGRYMHTTGHRTQSHGVEDWEPDIFSYMQGAGYYINWFGKDDALGPNAFKYIDYWQSENENHVVEFLSTNAKEPFFTFIPTIGAHPAYRGKGDIGKGECFKEGDPGYWSFYNNCSGSVYDWRDIEAKAPLRPPINAHNKSYPMYRRADGIVHYHDLDREPLVSEDKAFWYRLNAIYLDMVHRVDAQLGDLLAAIDGNTNAAPGLWERTAFFVSSDHGDFGGDHHLIEKWPGAMDDMLTHVPFVARIPGGVKGHIVNEPMQVWDLFPTLLDLAGVTPNQTHFARSLMPQLMGAAGDPDRVVYSEGGFLYPTEIEPIKNDCDLKNDFYGKRGQEEILNYTNGCEREHWDDPNWVGCLGSPRAIMARTLDYKLVYRPREVSEFYDLKKDPRELANLWGQPEVAQAQQQMLRDLLRYFQETADVTPLEEDSTGYPAERAPAPRAERWWERYNPNLHPELMTMTVDGNPIVPE